MNTICKRMLLPAMVLALLAAPALMAQTPKPVVAVSLSGIDELMSDIDFITKSAGVEDYGNLFKLLAAPYTVGIDKTKPWGLLVRSDGENFMPLGFVPVKDLKVVFAAVKEQIGEPRDVGGGIWEISDPAPLFVKEKGGFAYVANESKYLESLPEDPLKLVGGLAKDYDLGLRVFVQNVPREQREWAIEQLKEQNANALERQLRGKGEDDPEYKLAKRLAESQLQRISDAIYDSDEVTLGWSTDSMAKKTYLDFTMTAKAGTPTARRLALAKGNESSHGGFELPGAAATLTITARMEKDDVEQLVLMLDAAKVRAFEEIDNEGDLETDAKKATAKEVVQGLIGTVIKTAEQGKLDGGAALVLAPKEMTFVAGGKIAEPEALEDSLRKLVELAKDEPDFPGVKFNAQTHKGVAFHTMSIPVPESEEQARKVLGEKLDVVVGIGQESAYLAVGHEAAAKLKEVIDASGKKKADVPPLNLTVALTPIFKFAGSIEDNAMLEMIAATLEKSEGKDHITIKATPIENGVTYRLTIEEGILKAIGQAVKAQGAGL